MAKARPRAAIEPPSLFPGFDPEGFAWFNGLEADNSKAYFDANRATYLERVRGPLEALFSELTERYGGSVKMFRQHRDTRFSADKRPIKTTTYGLIVDRPDSRLPLYAQLSARGLFAGTGLYELAPDQLQRYREAVYDEDSGTALDTLVRELVADGFEVSGEALASVPRGYAKSHPRARLLAHKELLIGRLAPPAACLGREAGLGHVTFAWDALGDFIAWADEHVGPSAIPPELRYARGH